MSMAILRLFSTLLIGTGFVFNAFSGAQNVYQAQPGAQNVYQQQTGAQGQVQTYAQPQASDLNAVGVSSLSGAANPQVQEKPNTFLEYYSRQGSEIEIKTFVQEGTKLVKRNISSDDLRKAVIIFTADWCPYCQNFLASFAPNVEILRLAGIKVIFVAVPSVDKLKEWKDPNVDEYNAAENKVASHGIKLLNGVKVALLGDKATLNKTGVEGLPVVIAVKDVKEYFRGVGQQGVSKLLYLGNQATLAEFLGIWDDQKTEKSESIAEQKNKKSKNAETKAQKQHIEKKSSSNVLKTSQKKPSKNGVKISQNNSVVDLYEAHNATESLNRFYTARIR